MAESSQLKDSLIGLQQALSDAQKVFNDNQKLLEDRSAGLANQHAELQGILDSLKRTEALQKEYIAKASEIANVNDK